MYDYVLYTIFVNLQLFCMNNISVLTIIVLVVTISDYETKMEPLQDLQHH